MKRRSTIDLHMKVLLGASIYLIIASVFGLNNQFTHEAVAKDSTATKPPNLKQGAKAISALPDVATQGGSNTKKTAAAPATSGALVEPHPKPNLPSPSVSLAPSKNSRGGDLGSNDDATFRHNAEDIATELTSLTPQEIREYPIADLSNEDIKLVLQFLDPVDLTKVFLYISQQDLLKIQQRLTPEVFAEYLNRLAESDRTQVEGRLISTSGGSIN